MFFCTCGSNLVEQAFFCNNHKKQELAINHRFLVVRSSERMKSEATDLHYPTTVDVADGTRQVSVRLEYRLVQVGHTLKESNSHVALPTFNSVIISINAANNSMLY
jgi:hypothetical protein